MQEFDPRILKQLYIPPPNSHKGQNGKVLVIGGSKLFHAASMWPLSIASKIVDMVFYASVPENNQLVQNAKQEFRNGIVIPRSKLDQYLEEADAVLIGPGLPRLDGQEAGDENTKELTERLLTKYPHKKWVVDGGSLQVVNPSLLPPTAIITPHPKEFATLLKESRIISPANSGQISYELREKDAKLLAKQLNITVLLKGEQDVVCSPNKSVKVTGGNAGMTKGGTGDVLAGLTAALYAKNEAYLSACAASYINKKAGDLLYERVGFYFNASDLVDEIPRVMKDLLL